MVKFLSYVLVGICLLFLFSYFSHPRAQEFRLPPGGCGIDGGDIPRCIQMFGRQGAGHRVPAHYYKSGGTYVLNRAGCISPGANFGFHSAFTLGPNGPQVDHSYNNVQRRALYNAGRPGSLVSYLDSVGAFNSLELTTLSASQVSSVTGIPLCH